MPDRTRRGFAGRGALVAALFCGLVVGCEPPRDQPPAQRSLSACHDILARGAPQPTPLRELVASIESQHVERQPSEALDAYQGRLNAIARSANEGLSRQSGEALVLVTAGIDGDSLSYDAADQTLTIGTGEWQRGLIPVTFFYGAGAPGQPRRRWTAFAAQTEEHTLETRAAAPRYRTPRTLARLDRRIWGIAFDGDYATTAWPPAFVAGIRMAPQAMGSARDHLRLLVAGSLTGPILIADELSGYERPSPTTVAQIAGVRKLVTLDLVCAVIYDDRNREILYTIRNSRR